MAGVIEDQHQLIIVIEIGAIQEGIHQEHTVVIIVRIAATQARQEVDNLLPLQLWIFNELFRDTTLQLFFFRLQFNEAALNGPGGKSLFDCL